MQPLACRSCAARVSVAKYSPAHTSVQWTADASRACREMAAGHGDYLPRCTSLDRTIDDAVAHGEVAMTTRSEPVVAPLAAPHAAPR
ncbi:hypothetical protein ABZV91_05570 [Nocardia sp. NPDC004568]|uniref:hypothetical protein n=1 Tax=Nocardia sp. NPDC004568 TaxID=3154551 RepID=UPI0033B7F30E